SALTLGSGTLSPVFASGTINYSNAVALRANSLTVTPTSSAAAAVIRVRVNGGSYATVSSGTPSSALPLNAGANLIEVQVTSSASTTVKTYSVTVNTVDTAPVANAGGPYSSDVGDSLALDGSASSDPDVSSGDSIVSYAWDLDNNGTYDVTTSSATTTVSWALLQSLLVTPTDYPADPITGFPNRTVRLRVTDSFGVSSTSTTVLRIYNNQPVASFTASPNPSACHQTVSFNASASYQGDPAHAIVGYSWNYGDGASDNNPGGTANHAYNLFGTYTVTLTVTDNNIPPKTATTTRTVTVNQGNQSPTASTGGPYTVAQGSSLNLNGTGSSDPDAGCGDSIVSYSWDLDDNGTYDFSGATPVVTASQLSGFGLGVGSHTIRLRVTDTFGATGTGTTTLTIQSSAPSITSQPASRTNAAGTMATFTVSATGEAPLAYQWRKDGTDLTDGGNISGATSSSFTNSSVTTGSVGSYTVVITNSYGSVTSSVATLAVTCPAITVSPGSLPDPVVGVSYSQTVGASGGTAPYTFTVAGTFPEGLTLSPGGVISGIALYVNQYQFEVIATDAHGCSSETGTANYFMDVSCPGMTLTPAALPSVVTGTAYSTNLSVSGGVAPYTFALIGTSVLPPGLTLNTNTGVISGTPTTAGTYDFTVEGYDAYFCPANQAYTMEVTAGCPTITLSPATLLDGNLGISYSQTFTASGGVASYSYAVTNGSLPNGLSLAPNGSLTGIPLALATNTFTVTATDANGCPGSANYTLAINPSGSVLDTNKPTVAITSPMNRTITNTAAITVSGIARDSSGKTKTGVALVLCSLNNGAPQNATTINRFTNWTANVTLQPGWNSFTAQALDYRGNASLIASNIYFYGNTANVVGQYNGLFYETNSAGAPVMTEQSAGAVFNLAVTIGRTFGGTICVGGSGYQLKGLFDLSGKCTTNVSRARSAKPDLTVTLHVDWTGTSKQITGTVSCASENWTAPLLADLA
ncbi:MAG: putative Ig domain-containing protein, partial [Limisphaerales bacterium]